MKAANSRNLTSVFDIDLIALLIYNGVSIERVTDESGRIAFHFPAVMVAKVRSELSSGKCRVEPSRWSSIVRRIHSEFLSPSAKAALRNGGATRRL